MQSQISFRNSKLELSNGAAVIGVIELDPREPFDACSIQHQAKEFIDCGAVGIELGIRKQVGTQTAIVASAAKAQAADLSAEEEHDALQDEEEGLGANGQDPYTQAFLALGVEQRADMLAQACKAVLEIDDSILVAVYTSDVLAMEKTAEAGAQLIIDPMALREPGALEAVSRLKLNVCLCFDQQYRFDEDDNVDVCGKISEFFYERLDACINAKIARSRIMLDPTLSHEVGVDYRIKLQGRLKSFTSFALPLSCELPRVFPGQDEFLRNNMSVTVAVALFVAQQGFKIIRTKHVYDLGLALDTWQALNYSARPFKIRRLFKRRFKGFGVRKNK